MKCPNCHKEMIETKRYVDRWEPYDGFWTRDYVAKILYYSCKDCNIKRKIDRDLRKDEWTLPKEMQPTEKQIAYAEKIIRRLELEDDDDFWEARDDGEILVTKHQFWEFINKNQNKYIKKMKSFRDYDYGCGDDYDYDMLEIGINGF